MTDDRDVKTMTIYFPIPAVADKYLTRPISYIGHLLGHESGGSILSALKERAWANGLSAGIHLTNYDFACVGVTVELSDQGVDHVQEIGSCVFAYLYMMGQKGPQEWVWKELQDTEEMNFRFINKVEPSDYATSLANGMHLYSIPHTVSGANLLYQMDLAQIEEYRSYLRPENSFIVVSHRGFAGKTALKEHWYGTEHNNRAYDAESELAAWQKAFTQESEWSAVLDLPQPNPFIPTEFDLKPPLAPVVSSKEDPTEAAAASGGKGTGREYPRLAERKLDVADVLQSMVQQPRVEEPDVPPTPPGEEEQEEEEEEEEEGAAVGGGADLPAQEGEFLSCWHLQDTTWKVPKLNVKIALETLHATSTPQQIAFTDLFCMCLKELLNEFSYYADCAGLYYDVSLAKGGIDLALQGYNHKLHKLVSKIVEEIQNLGSNESACSPALFQRMKQKCLRNLKNYLFWQPYYHAIVGGLLCLEDPRFGNAEKYRALEGASLSDFQSFARTFVGSFKAQVLVHGNITATETQSLTALILEKLQFKSLPYSQFPTRRVVQLEAGVTYLYRQHCQRNNPNEVNSSVSNVYVVGLSAGSTAASPDPPVEHPAVLLEAHVELLVHMMSEPAFDQLRTKEQLGYIVFTGVKRLNQQFLGIDVIVQSSHKDADYLDGRVETFLVQYRDEILATMSEADFTDFTASMIEKFVEKPKNIDQESNQHWAEIKNGMYWFSRKATLADVLRSGAVTLSSMQMFFDKYMHPTSSQRCKLSSQFYGKGKCYVTPAASGPNTTNTRVHIIEDPSTFRRSMGLFAVPPFAPC